MPKTIIVLIPHPDDAEFYAGGTLAKLAEEGNKIIIVTTTDGCKGSFEHTSQELAALRAEEATNAARVLGVEPPIFLGYKDFELDLLPAGTLREQYVHLIRQHKPDIVFAEDILELNEEVHPDHRAVALAASDAIQYAMLPLLYPQHRKGGLEPHFVTEKYFFANNHTRVNKIIDISTSFDRKMAALAEHKTQVKFLVDDIFAQARLAGIEMPGLLGSAATDHLAVLTLVMRSEAEELGQSAGFQYGEAFRYVRFDPLIESLLEGKLP